MGPALILLYALSLLAAAALGREAEAGRALLEGAQAALPFALQLAGGLCLWSGVTELLERARASALLSRLLSPALRRLFPRGANDPETLSALSENVSANLLGLGNAATPAGIRAAKGLKRLGGRDELCLLVVLNTASIQLFPAGAGSLRAALGASSPFDIVPAVWFSSACSLLAGLGAAALLRRLWR